MLKSVLRTPPSITAFIKHVPVLSPSGQLELFKFIPDEFVSLCTPRLSMWEAKWRHRSKMEEAKWRHP